MSETISAKPIAGWVILRPQMQALLVIGFLMLGGFIKPALAEIRVHCVGQGPAVYLIGGGPAFTTRNLQPVQDKLAIKHRACRWDMRGVGDNAALPVDSGTSALVQWLRDMQEVLPNERVILWGHSWGALQVLLFARQHPQRVSQLILSAPVDPALLSLEHIEQKRFVHPNINNPVSIDNMGTPLEELHYFRSKIASYFVDGKRGWNYAQGFTRQDANNKLNVRIWDEYRASPVTDGDVKQLADKISGLIHCRDDVLQPEALREYQRLLPTAQHHILPGCAHFPWEENRRAYYRALFASLSIHAH